MENYDGNKSFNHMPAEHILLSLWGAEIAYDKKAVQLRAFSAFLEQLAKKSAETFLDIGKRKQTGWLVAGTDFLGTEMKQVCSAVEDYIIKHNILTNPNWELFLEPYTQIAESSKELTLNLHQSLVNDYINHREEQAQKAYQNSLANSEGLGFGIISNSFTAHFVYAMQAARKEAQNERAAQKAADLVRRQNDPIKQAAEITTKAYHEAHEPFVLNSLAQFYSEIESFIYAGTAYDKQDLDGYVKKANEILREPNNGNSREVVIQAFRSDICCGDAVLYAVQNGLVDESFLAFCASAPFSLLRSSATVIEDWLRKEKHTNRLYNRSVFDSKTLRSIEAIRRIFLNEQNPNTSLYNAIIGNVYADEMESVEAAFDFNSAAIERYASEEKHIVVSEVVVQLFLIFCNNFCSQKMIEIMCKMHLNLPVNTEQLLKKVESVNREIDIRAAEIRKAQQDKDRQEAEERAEQQKVEAENERKRKRAIKFAMITAGVLILVIIFATVWKLWLFPEIIQPKKIYSEALMLLSGEQFDAAISDFEILGEYKDSASMAQEAKYQKASWHFKNKDFASASNLLEELGGYKDSEEMLREAKYQKANGLFDIKDFISASTLFEELGEYKDSIDRYKVAQYHYANELLSQKLYVEARTIFNNLAGYENSDELSLECSYLLAMQKHTDGKLIEAMTLFEKIKDYKDSSYQIILISYEIAVDEMNKGNYSGAISLFESLEDNGFATEKLTECKYLLAKQCLMEDDYVTAKTLFEEIPDYKDVPQFLSLFSKVKNTVFERVGDGPISIARYEYLWVRVVIDAETCSTKVLGWYVRSNDFVNRGEKLYRVDNMNLRVEWKTEKGKVLMAFEGDNPTEDKSSYQQWTISSNWDFIKTQLMEYDGKPRGEIYTYSRIADDEEAQRAIQKFEETLTDTWRKYIN